MIEQIVNGAYGHTWHMMSVSGAERRFGHFMRGGQHLSKESYRAIRDGMWEPLITATDNLRTLIDQEMFDRAMEK